MKERASELHDGWCLSNPPAERDPLRPGAVACGRLKRNQIAGIRTSRTLSSDAAWQVAHVRAERPTVLAGVVGMATGLTALLPVQVEAVGIAVLAGAAVMLALEPAWATELPGTCLRTPRTVIQSDEAPV